ncbi:MAG: hypothetical protein GF329_04385 [Candidatus Lokiarchaeota archaeon]|nr:hypothetical protein [Candidatus Lokiarchaeota archaeon]
MAWNELTFFLGCTSLLHKDTAENMTRIMDKVGIKYQLLEDEPCCGGILFLQGNIEEGIKKAKDNIVYFKENNVKRMLLMCPECMLAFKREYPKYFDWDMEIKHTSELIADLIKEGKLELNPVKLKVTYHDSCHLGRYLGVYDAPRYIINKIPDIKFKEMNLSKSNSHCCGGPIRDPYVQLRNDMTLDILKNERRKGKIIVTGCPTCRYNFNTVAELFDKKTRSVDIVDLVAYSAGIIPELKLKSKENE